MDKKKEELIREEIHNYLDNSQLELLGVGINFNNAEYPTLTFETRAREIEPDSEELTAEEIINNFVNSSFDEVSSKLADSVIDGIKKHEESEEV